MSLLSSKTSKNVVGLSVTEDAVYATCYDSSTFNVVASSQVFIPKDVFGPCSDTILNGAQLSILLQQVVGNLGIKPSKVYLSIPSTLLRLVEMPKIQKHELYLSLSAEAEGYKAFDGSEALVDFVQINGATGTNSQKLVFTAVRKDTLHAYLKACSRAKLKVAAIEPEELSIVRAMAGTGVLDSMAQQLGADVVWGSVFASSDRLRFLVWRGNTLLELREVQIPSDLLRNAQPDALVIEDVLDETRRTVQVCGAAPQIWLTHNLPTVINEVLMEQLQVPVKPCLISPGVELNGFTPNLASLGACLRQAMLFPLGLNLSQGKAQAKVEDVEQQASVAQQEETGENPMAWAMMAGMAGLLLLAVTYVGLMFYQGALSSDLQKMEQDKNGLLSQQTMLSARKEELKREYEIQGSIVQIAKAAEERNRMIFSFVSDLSQLTPPQVWVHSTSFDTQVKLEGKTLSHNAAIAFAKNFDARHYISGVVINTLKEDMVGPNPVYNFTLSGGVAVPPAPEVAETAAAAPTVPHA
jgi:hypothetical protein